MKRWLKYMSAFAFTAMLITAIITGAEAQHRGGGGGGSHGGGGGSHGGGGGFHGGGGGGFHGGGGGGFRGGGGGGFRGGSSFHGGGGFGGNAGIRGGGGFRGGNAYRGSGGFRGGNAYRGGGGSFRGGNAYRGGGGYYRGGRYYGGYGGGYYRGGRYYGPGFRYGFGWGYPSIGGYLGFLPYGYYPFYYNSLEYYYYGGAFYRPYNGGYEVVAPPIGASVPSLPSNAQPILIDGVQYYEADGVYYQESVDDSGRRVYIVVGKDGVLDTSYGANVNDQPPMSDNDDPIMDNSSPNNNPVENTNTIAHVSVKVGDIVDQLPADCRKVTLNKKKYHVSPDNVFYEEFKDADGTGYRVASVPAAND